MTSRRSGGLPPAIAYHRLPIRVLNALLRGADAVGLGRALGGSAFDADALMQQARHQTGLEDFGDQRFVAPLRLLCEGLDSESGLNPLGRVLTRISLLRLLKNRLWAEDLIARYPEILERALPPPVVVVGLARSGTTRLHRLLAADPGFIHLKAWESVHPVPWPESFKARALGKPEPRIANIEGALKAVLYMSPQIASVHPLGAHEVEEEVGLIQHGISSQLFEIITYLPTFSAYLMREDQTHAYEYMVRLMKVVSWWRGDDPDKPWVLKTPQHMQDLDALMRVFPDAKLVCTHRDPVTAVGSACSMTWNSIVRDTDRVDPHWVGREWLDKTDAMLKKTLRVRAEMVASEQQMDVLYHDISADWEGAIGRVYEFINRPLTEQAKARMGAWLEGNNQHKHGAHKYSLEDFGLSAEQVDRQLAYYRERFDIPYESRNPHLDNNGHAA